MNIYLYIPLFILIIFLGIFSLIVYLLNFNRYYRLMIYSLKYFDYLSSSKRKPSSRSKNLFISLTTTPQRLFNIDETLKSLLDQSVQIEKIYLCIPYQFKKTGKPYVIPNKLHNLTSIEIVRCDDYGPATKLFPVLKKVHPDDIIIYLDDDNIYPYRLIENLLNASDKYPNSAISIEGLNINKSTDQTFKEFSSSDLKVDIVQGYAGVLIKPRFFGSHDEIFNYGDAPQEFFSNDDFWISYRLAQANVERIKLAFDVKNKPLPTKNFFIDGLSTTVNANKKKEQIMLQYWKRKIKK